MKTCTFFGHRTCPASIRPALKNLLKMLIIEYDTSFFYVGSQGEFDALVRGTLRELKEEYPEIDYTVVLAYVPVGANIYEDFTDTVLPEGIEQVHPRYAIQWRNRWMLQRADYVVGYVAHEWGGAARFMKLAEHRGKTVFNLYGSSGGT